MSVNTLFDGGALDILGTYFNSNFFTAMLFVNESAIEAGLIADNATLVEASGGGYSRQIIDGAYEINVDTPATQIPSATFLPIQFEFTGALTGDATETTVYGFAILAASASTPHVLGDVIFAAPLSEPFIPADGDMIIINPVFELSHGTPTI